MYVHVTNTKCYATGSDCLNKFVQVLRLSLLLYLPQVIVNHGPNDVSYQNICHSQHQVEFVNHDVGQVNIQEWRVYTAKSLFPRGNWLA